MDMFRLLGMHYCYGFVKIELRGVLKIGRLYRTVNYFQIRDIMKQNVL